MNHREVTYYIDETPKTATVQLDKHGAVITLQDIAKRRIPLSVYVPRTDFQKLKELWDEIQGVGSVVHPGRIGHRS